jgi:hypothetical protein
MAAHARGVAYAAKAASRVVGRLRLEQRQRPLGAVGGPHGQHAPLALAQRQGTRPAFHGKDCPSGDRLVAFGEEMTGYFSEPPTIDLDVALVHAGVVARRRRSG